MGRSVFCGNAFGTSFEARRWLSLDPCGIFGISLSWSVHIYALSVIPLTIISNSTVSKIVYFCFYVPLAFLAMMSLYMASTTDPGSVPLGARPLVTVRRAGSIHSTEGGGANNLNATNRDESSHSDNPTQQQEPLQPAASSRASRAIRRCHKCQDNFKPPRAHHDSVTGRCIVKFDHFCPWVNNSIGALNHKFFCLFLFYTSACCFLSLLLLFIRVVQCGYVHDGSEENKQPESTLRSQDTLPVTEDGQRRFLTFTYDEECNRFYDSHWILVLFVISLVFFVFTLSMGCEQLDAIKTGKGKIARMKMQVGQSGTEFSRVTEEFNEMFGGESPVLKLHWLLPLPVSFPRGMKKVVLGYEWDESMHSPYQEDNEGGSLHANGESALRDLEMGATSSILPPPPLPGPSAFVQRGSSDLSLDAASQDGVKNRRTKDRDSTIQGTLV